MKFGTLPHLLNLYLVRAFSKTSPIYRSPKKGGNVTGKISLRSFLEKDSGNFCVKEVNGGKIDGRQRSEWNNEL